MVEIPVDFAREVRAAYDDHRATIEAALADAEDKDGQATCEDGEQLPMFVLAAAQIAVTAQRFLKDKVKQSFQVSPSGITRIA